MQSAPLGFGAGDLGLAAAAPEVPKPPGIQAAEGPAANPSEGRAMLAARQVTGGLLAQACATWFTRRKDCDPVFDAYEIQNTKSTLLTKMREKNIILQHFNSHAIKSKGLLNPPFRFMYCLYFLF